ncbi:MAG: ATP synthase subunit I [Moraxella sp.]|nr:ATP synthase subunit I [Moraxella sp.]
MTRPAPRSRLAPIAHVQRLLLRTLFVIVMVAIGADWLLAKGLLLAKGVSAGAFLAYMLNFVFIKLASKARSRANEMLLAIYAGEIAKWVIAFVGFAIIFKFAKPISGAGVFVGFIVMQIVAMIGLFLSDKPAK